MASDHVWIRDYYIRVKTAIDDPYLNPGLDKLYIIKFYLERL